MSTVETHESRRAPRRRVIKRGQIVFNRGHSTIDCVVRNISSRGARIEVPSVVGIPDAFLLVVPPSSSQPCRVVWRRFKEIGVSFAES